MSSASLHAMVAYADRLLRTAKINDYERAANGLQVENRGNVHRIAAAVDGSIATIRLAVAAKADLLLVHHGLFWASAVPWTGRKYELIQLLIEQDLAVYSSHLPLDAHPKLGNNVQLSSALGLRNLNPFFWDHGQYLGFQAKVSIRRNDLAARLQKATGVKPQMIPAGPAICQRIGVVTGGAGSELKIAAAEGVDTFVTGEGPHWTYAMAEELGLNVFYGGHYATETFGVRTFGAHLSKKFKLPFEFIDCPTGL